MYSFTLAFLYCACLDIILYRYSQGIKLQIKLQYEYVKQKYEYVYFSNWYIKSTIYKRFLYS